MKTKLFRIGYISGTSLAALFLVAPLYAQTSSAEGDVAGEAEAPSASSEESESSSNTEEAEAEPAEEQTTEPEPEEEPPPPTYEEEPPPPAYEEEENVSSVSETGEIQVAEAPPAVKARSPFDQGTIRVGVGLGWASSSTQDWMILGLGAGYFFTKGLEAHFDTTFWVIGDPFIATITPGVRYVFHFVPKVKPYVGTFYRHYFVGDSWDDTNAIGARVGVNFMVSPMSYFGAGMIYEHFLDDNLYTDRDQFYPEITFAFSF